MFEVCAKCGHVGKSNYVEKTFAIKATSGKEAAAIARNMPRVKHHHQDAIRYVEKIDESRFNEIIENNSSDLYFQCFNIQDQRELCELEILKKLAKIVIFQAKENETTNLPIMANKHYAIQKSI